MSIIGVFNRVSGTRTICRILLQHIETNFVIRIFISKLYLILAIVFPVLSRLFIYSIFTGWFASNLMLKLS